MVGCLKRLIVFLFLPLCLYGQAQRSATYDKLKVGTLNGMAQATTSTWLQSNLASTAANTTIQVTANQSLTGDIVVTNAGIVIQCLNNATITYATNARIQMQGNNQGIEGCTFIGPGTGVTTFQMVVFSGLNQFFRKNKYTGFGSTIGNGQVEVIAGANHFEFSGNSTQPGGNADSDGDLFINNCCTASASMTDFRITNNDIGEFIAHATSAGTTLSKIVSTANHFHNGQNSKIEFCEEIGVFGGSSVSDVTSTGNTCTMQSAANGGFSFGGPMNYATETGDVFDANGFVYLISPFEHVVINNATIQGNTANNGTFAGVHDGFTCDRCSNSTFTGNVINGGSTSSSAALMHINVSSTTNPTANNNTVNDNVLILPTGSAAKGIWHQCNATGATCTGNIISGNLIKSDGTAGSIGIVIENDTGTTTNVLITGNAILGPATGINNGSTVTNTTIFPNRNTAATQLVDSGSGTLIQSLIIKKGSGAGNYTTASTTFAVADSTNLCYSVTIPAGWKLAVSMSGNLGTATAAVLANYALTDNAACSTANAGILVEGTVTTTAAGVLQPIALDWVINGDGNAHNVALQYKTSNGADSATLLNSSATSLPTMVFTLMPSN